MSRPTIELICPPFRGHLHPMLGLGRALASIADVRVLSTPAAQAEIAAAGLPGESVIEDRDEEIEAIANPPHRVGSHPLRLAAQLRRTLALFEHLAAQVHRRYTRWKPDLVIVDSVLPPAGLVAHRLGVPWWTACASPCAIEPMRGTPGYLGGWSHAEGGPGRLRDAVGRLLVRTFKRGVHRWHRRQLVRLGLPVLYRNDGSEAVYSAECILAFGLPEFEFPRIWPSAVQLVGPMLYTPPLATAGPVLEPDQRHVLVTFGTHLRAFKDTLARAAAALPAQVPGLVFHFSDGRPGPAVEPGTGAFRRHAYVPYDRGLDRFDLVVHHGGAGITYRCLEQARPSVVLPLDYDQFDQAARIVRAGVGRRIRSVGELPHAIRSALADSGMRAACTRLQQSLRAFEPTRRVVARVGQFLAQRGRA